MNSVFAVPSTLRPSFLAVALGIVLLLSFESMASDSSLTFIGQIQSNPGSLHSEFFTVQMFTISSSGTLDSIWSTEDAWISLVRVFPEVNSLLIEQAFSNPSGLRVISLSDMVEVANIDLSHEASVVAIRQYANGQVFGQIAFDLMSRNDNRERSIVRISPSRVTSDVSPSTEQLDGELRLAGLTNFNSYQDCIPFLSVTQPSLHPTIDSSGICLKAFPVPDSVISFKDSRAWILFAHEPAFLALRSASNGTREESEILIYSRLDNTWSSVLVPGDANSVWTINGWIAGQVRYANPNNSYTTQPDYPPEKGASDFLLNPLTLKLVSFKMTSRGEILWVDSDTVYYRSGTSLFKARIGEKDLVDQELILTDPRVEDIHWAFRRKSVIE
ncbi:MAG: hypothetical protein IPH75_12290 [bacterium]|nr:hypothetical protein [bacterium]